MFSSLVASLLLATFAYADIDYIPPLVPYQGPVTAEFTSLAGGLGVFDEPKVKPWNNISSFDWWYFDIVDPTSDASMALTLLSTGTEALTPHVPVSPVLAMAGTFANGTMWSYGALIVGGAAFMTTDNCIYSTWTGLGALVTMSGSSSSATAKPNYSVNVVAPGGNLNGKLNLQSIAAPRYPCAAIGAGANEQIAPHIGWANAVPDAVASFDFTINGEDHSFTGYGYHDKNWGDSTFDENVKFWYWGHARVGPYSIVWFDLHTPDGIVSQSGYVADNQGNTFTSISCATNASTVRPWGANSDYPPTPSTGTPTGLLVTLATAEGTFIANVTTGPKSREEGVYQSYAGSVVGGFQGEATYNGRAYFEIMHIS